jgi:hypothetical protein
MMIASLILFSLWALYYAGLRLLRPAAGPRLLQAAQAQVVALGVFALGALMLLAIGSTRVFSGYFANGAFQMLNALRRLEDGQRLGRDFQFFHGPLMPYLHWPLYHLAPSLASVEAARYGLSLAGYLGAYLLLFRAAAGAWPLAAFLTLAAAGLGDVIRLGSVAGPGNSGVGVRSLAPMLFIAWRLRGPRGAAGVLISGGLLSLALLTSTEHGMAIAAAFVATGFLWELFRLPGREGWLRFGATLAVAAVGFVLLGRLLAGSCEAFRSMLSFNYVAVPKDQFWYFGVPPNPWVDHWGAFLHLKFVLPAGLHVLTIAVLGWLWRGRWGRHLDAASPALALALAYGVLGSVGYLGMSLRAYMEPLLRLDLALLLAVFALVWRAEARSRPRLWRNLCYGAALAGLLLWPHAGLMDRELRAREYAPAYQALHQAPGLSEAWGDFEASTRRRFTQMQAEAGRPLTLWSAYSTLLEYRAGVFNPHTDYIIHALGPGAREDYLWSFVSHKPDLVQTLRPRRFLYEEWLHDSTWPFYEAVLRDYDLSFFQDHAVFWKRRAKPRALYGEPVELLTGPLRSPAQVDLSRLPAGRLLVLEAYYSLKNPWAKLPVFGGMPRYFIEPGGTACTEPISLPPYESSWRFPVVRRADGDKMSLSLAVRGLLPGASFELQSLKAWPVIDDESSRAMLLDIDPAHPDEAPLPPWEPQP